MIYQVEVSKKALKQLKKIPKHLIVRLDYWIDEVERFGLEKTRIRSGYHDEPLKGGRKGQRSIRLNKAYRAIYVVRKNGIEFVEIQEVHKHDY